MPLVRVRNTTRGSSVAGRADVADSPLRRLIGLMGRRGWDDTDGLLLRPCNSIHTLFMRMPIDVLFVDRDGWVVGVGPERPPWRLGPLKRRAACVLELPSGAIAASRTRRGDRLVVEGLVGEGQLTGRALPDP